MQDSELFLMNKYRPKEPSRKGYFLENCIGEDIIFGFSASDSSHHCAIDQKVYLKFQTLPKGRDGLGGQTKGEDQYLSPKAQIKGTESDSCMTPSSELRSSDRGKQFDKQLSAEKGMFRSLESFKPESTE